MSDSAQPAIPAWLANLPTVGGLVVPWITVRTDDGRHLLGTIERALAERALRERRCGVCARHLDQRAVLLMRLVDLARRCTNEPALDPACAHYTTNACPMISGRLDAYRRTSIHLDESTASAPDTSARLGAPAEPWFAVWVDGYRLTTDRGHLVASYAHTSPLRIRPITWKLPGLW